MKKTFYWSILMLIVVGFSSCNNDECVETEKVETEMNESLLNLETSLSQSDYEQLSANLSTIVNTRASINDEQACKNALLPLIKDGELIQKQILEQLSSEGSQKEINDYFTDLSEEQLATLSFLVYNINEMQNSEEVNTRAVSMSRVRDCLSFALGISMIKEIGLEGCITAATARQALIAVGKRYLGYIGLALMIADFADCIG